MDVFRCGDHTVLAYSKISRTRDLYKIEKMSLFLLHTVHLSKPRTLFALWTVSLTCFAQLRSFINSVPETSYCVVLLSLLCVILICYKIVFNLNGLNFTDYFELCKSTKTRSNHQYKIQTKLAKLNCYKYSFFVKIIKFWNDLPSNVIHCHHSPNINKFKLRLKNHMNIYWMYIPYFVEDVSVIFIYFYYLAFI